MIIKEFAWSLTETVYCNCRIFPYPDWYSSSQDLVDMRSLTDVTERNVDYGTEVKVCRNRY